MYTTVQVLEPKRHSVRRGVHIECNVLAEGWDEPVPYDVEDLSGGGMYLSTPLPLEEGTEMYVALRPRGWPGSVDLIARAVVRRVEMRRRRAEKRRAGMGIAFVDLPEDDVEALEACLYGTPPALTPRTAEGPRHYETLWVDEL